MTEFEKFFKKLDKTYADSEEKFVKNVVLYRAASYVITSPEGGKETYIDKENLIALCSKFDVLISDNDGKTAHKVIYFGENYSGPGAFVTYCTGENQDGGVTLLTGNTLYSKEHTIS